LHVYIDGKVWLAAPQGQKITTISSGRSSLPLTQETDGTVSVFLRKDTTVSVGFLSIQSEA